MKMDVLSETLKFVLFAHFTPTARGTKHTSFLGSNLFSIYASLWMLIVAEGELSEHNLSLLHVHFRSSLPLPSQTSEVLKNKPRKMWNCFFLCFNHPVSSSQCSPPILTQTKGHKGSGCSPQPTGHLTHPETTQGWAKTPTHPAKR